MLRVKPKQISLMTTVYDKIPENHLLRLIDRAVDFSFINGLVADSYCLNNGRPAKEPEMMMKLLFLQYLYNLSDVKVIEEGALNLAWLWFLGLNPEDELPDPSLLAKFRTQRLKDLTLDDIITEIVRQCVDKGIIKSNSVSIDATHIEANTIKAVPERIMKHLAKKIFEALEEDLGRIPPEVDTNIPNYKQIEDHKLAKQTMKAYLEGVMKQATPFAGAETEAAIAEATEILSDERFIIQKGIRSLVDKDARVGRKSKTDNFFGYKNEFIMTTDERIITAVAVHSGEYSDGQGFRELLERTKEAGIKPGEVYGDKAYFRKDILDTISYSEAKAYIPVSASAYKIDEEFFRYNKDSDQWICRMGNHTVSKEEVTKKKDGKEQKLLKFTFDKELCVSCPHRAECLGKTTTKARRLLVSLNAAEFYEINQQQKTEEFKTKYKKRAAHEWKNAEMKRFHGLARARGYGLRAMAVQAKLTAIVVNLKRIAALVAEKKAKLSSFYSAFVDPICWTYSNLKRGLRSLELA